MVVAAVSLVRNLVAVVSTVVGVVSLVVAVVSLVVAVASLVVAVASLVVAVVSLVAVVLVSLVRLLVVELFPVRKQLHRNHLSVFTTVFIVFIGEIIRCRNWSTGGTYPSKQYSHTSHNLKHYRLAKK